ncbi:hypothetical protein [Streptomyces sp. NPDC001927]
MASLVYFRKVTEAEGSVEYAFGSAPAETPRLLAMDTASRRAHPVDGTVDYTFLKASRKINALYDASGRWPEHGMSAS